ncbi:MAG: hypothetical protein JW709_10530, partial [Sedimentisphaerales bacterium]|nr:hypothetical protein [Sedimentisphaerales bacterium]
MFELKSIILLLFFALGTSWSITFAGDLTVDFGYPPPFWHTAICPPDDTYKTLVNEEGRLLYHYTRSRYGFQTTLALTVDEQAKIADQTLVSPRVPIVQTLRKAEGLTILEEAFALRQAGPAAKTWKYPAARKDGSRMHRNWANPQGNVTQNLSSVVIPGETAIMYNIQTPPGAAVTVVLGICEGFYDQPGKRVMHLRVEGASEQQVDTVADLGKNVAGAFWFEARDVDNDGFINLTVIATENSQDKVAILNGFWVFDAGVKKDDAALLAGKLDAQAGLALYAGDRDNISRNDVILVQVTNTGSADKTIEPKVTVNSMLSLELMKDRIRIDGHEVVLATHPIADLTEADAANGRRDAIMKLAPLTIPAGQTTSFAVVFCGGGWIDAQPTTLADVQKARQNCQSFWENIDLPYGRITVPDKNIQALIDSSIRNIWQAREIKNGMPAFQVGATCYRSLFIVDGSFILEAATMVGAGQDTRAGVEFMLSFQQDDGRFEILSRYHKENGIVLWTCVRHAMLTQSKDWLKSVWPKLEKTVAYIKHLRQLSYEDDTMLNDGLMPPGYPDGGIGWGNHYEYTNVYWNLLGLKAIIQAARWIGNDRQADEWQKEYDDFYA